MSRNAAVVAFVLWLATRLLRRGKRSRFAAARSSPWPSADTERTVLIRDGKIVDVGARVRVPANAQIMDMTADS